MTNKKILQNSLTFLLILFQFFIYIPRSEAAGHEEAIDFSPSDVSSFELSSDEDIDTIPEDEIISDQFNTSADQTLFDNENRTSQGGTIIFNPSDRKDLENIMLASSALPDLRSDLQELSRLSKEPYEQLVEMFDNDFTQLSQLAEDIETKYFNDAYLKERLLAHPEILAEIFSTVPEAIVVRLQDPAEKRVMEMAIDSILEIQIDRRVIETLNYLVRPKNDPRGGAGHQRIKVYRLRRNYTREETQFSKESQKAEQTAREEATTANEQEEQTVELYRSESEDSAEVESLIENAGLDAEAPLVSGQITDLENDTVDDFMIVDRDSEANISSHYSGQAIDISEIDQIKCTLVKKRRLGGSKKSKQAPYNVKLRWQSNEGYAQDQDALDSSFDEMFRRNSLESIYSMLSDLDIDLSNLDGVDLDIDSFKSIVALVGQSYLSEALGLPSADILQYDLTDMLHVLGGVLIADKFGLDKEPFQDIDVDSIDELTQAIGRYSVEKKLDLPYASMKGDSREQVFSQIGKARIAEELNIPLDAFDFNPITATSSDIYKLMGSRIFEERYALEKGSFNQNSLSEAREAANASVVNIILAFPESIDQDLGLTTGTTANLKKGSLGLPDYLNRLTEAHLLKYGYNYQNYRHVESSTNTGTIEGPENSLSNWRDEMHNTLEGSIDDFLTGNITEDLFINIANDFITRQLESTDSQREFLRSWLNSPNSSFTATIDSDNEALTEPILIDNYATAMGVTKTEFYQIFGTNSANGTFKRLGEKVFYKAIENQTQIQQRIGEIVSDSSSITEILRTYEFYRGRADTIKDHLGPLKSSAEGLRSELQGSAIAEEDGVQLQIDELGQKINTIENLVSHLESASQSSSILNTTRDLMELLDGTNGDFVNLSSVISQSRSSATSALNQATNSFRYELETVSRAAYEIITGEEQSDFRIGDLHLSQVTNNTSINLGGTSLGAADIVLFLSGQISPTEFLIMAGSAKLASELSIPPKTFYYISKVYRYIEEHKEGLVMKDVFFRGIGLALLEEKLGESLSFLFEPETMGVKITISALRDKIAEQKKISDSRANEILSEGLNLKGYNFEALMRGDFGAWSQARAYAEENDYSLGLVTGTTEKFVKGEPLADFSDVLLSPDEMAMFSGRLMISEPSIQAFLAAKNGEENPAINQIYFVENARYLNENNSNSESRESCATNNISNNIYLYYDRDGMHTFQSFSAANEYQKANQNKKINYIDEIAASLASYLLEQDRPGMGEIYEDNFETELFEKIKASLTSFISNKNQKNAFEGVGISVSDVLDENFNIPSEVTEKIFERSESAESDNVDFLYMSGYKIMNNLVGAYINDYLGISISGARITADDIYQMFNGNPTDVFAEIGSKLLGDEMGVESETIFNMVTAESEEQRNCLINQAASEILGDVLGISGLDLADILSGDLGSRRVEKVLDLPQSSFGGANLSELLGGRENDQGLSNNLVPLSKFIEAFKIPESKKGHDFANSALKDISDSYFSSYKNADLSRKMIVIGNYLSALGTEAVNQNPALVQNWIKLVENVSESIRAIIAYSNDLYGNENLAVDSLLGTPAYEETDIDDFRSDWRKFLSRAQNLDDIFGVARNTTLGLFQPPTGGAFAFISPDDYAEEVENNFISNSLQDIAIDNIVEMLGLSDKGFESKDVKNLISAIGNIDDPAFGTDPESEIYGFLDKLFGLKLDKHAGFTDGTIRSMIENPDRARVILLLEGARMFDVELGISGARTNFETFVNIFTGDKSALLELCEGDNFSSCVNDEMQTRVTDTLQEEVANRASDQITNFLSRVSGVDVDTTRVECDFGGFCQEVPYQASDQHSISMPREDLRGLFSGDFRPLMAIGIISGLGSIIGEEQTDAQGNTHNVLAVSDELIITYDDIYYAVWGDRASQGDVNYARQTAYASELARLNEEGEINFWVDNYENDESQPSIAVSSDFGYQGAGIPINVSPQTRALETGASAVSIGIRDDVNLAYPIPEGSPALADLPDEPAEPPLNEYWDEGADDYDWDSYNADFDTYSYTHDRWQTIRDAGERAAGEVPRIHQSNLEYSVLDCALYKMDSNVPAGFTKAMMKGNAYDRTVVMYGYVENILQGEADWLPDGSVQALFGAFETGDYSQVLAVTVADANITSIIDDYLTEHSPEIFGLSLQEGTTEALFAFAITGDLSENLSLNIDGQTREIKSLQNLYSSEWVESSICKWADKVLGFPAGKAYDMYKAYEAFEDARFVSSFWSADIDTILGLQDTVAFVSGQEAWVSNQMSGWLADNATASAKDIANQQIKFVQKSTTEATSQAGMKELGKSKADVQLKEATAAIISIVINLAFSEQIADVEQAIGLVPGTGSMLVGMLVQLAFNLPISPISIGLFVVMNLFGYYKTELICTADGYYPRVEEAPDPDVWDNPGLGSFNAMNNNTREAKFIESAQYKANRLIADLYEMPARTGDETLVPTQVMTGRWEDVQAWQGLLPGTICKRFGGNIEEGLCAGTKAGMWANPQTIEYTHIGF